MEDVQNQTQTQTQTQEPGSRMGHEARPLSSGWAIWWLLFGALGPLALVLLNGGLGYALVPWACRHGARAALHLVPAAAILLVAVAAAGAWRKWHESGALRSDLVEAYDAAGERPRSRFLAALGLSGSALAIIVIVAQWIPIFVLGPCERY